MKQIIQLASVVVLIILLQACDKKETPEDTFNVLTQALKDNDVKTFVKVSMSQNSYNELASEFENKTSSSDKLELASFDQILQLFKGDGAVDRIMTMIGPQVQTYRQSISYVLQNKDEMRGVFLQSFSDGYKSYSVKANRAVSDEDKEFVDNLENKLGLVFDKIFLTDPLSEQKIEQLITEAVNTINDLNVSSVTEVKTMSYDTALEKLSVILVGAKAIVAVYGISIDDILDSIKIFDVIENDNSATLKVTYDFLGQSFNHNITLMHIDDRWILIEKPL